MVAKARAALMDWVVRCACVVGPAVVLAREVLCPCAVVAVLRHRAVVSASRLHPAEQPVPVAMCPWLPVRLQEVPVVKSPCAAVRQRVRVAARRASVLVRAAVLPAAA